MRWLIRIAVALVACVVVAVGLLFLLPADRIGQLASDQLERQTGRKLTLSGDFTPTLFPTLGVKTGAITVSNADWASEPLMISAKGATVGVNLSALIGGNVEVETFELLSPVVYLERDASGRANWDLSGPTPRDTTTRPQAETDSARPSLALGRIVDGDIYFRDHSTGTSHALGGINGTVSLPKGKTTARIAVSGNLDGRDGAIEAVLGDWPAMMEGGISTVSGTLELGADTVGFDGTAGLGDGVPTVDVVLNASLGDPSGTAARFGLNAPAQLAALSGVSLEGKVLLSSAGVFTQADLKGVYGKAPVTGRLSATGDESWLETPEFNVETFLSLQGTGDVDFKGRAGQARPNLLSGQLLARFSDLRGGLRLAGIETGTPKGTFQTGKLDGELRVAASGKARLKNVVITLDQNVVSGEIAFRPQNPPYVEATLDAGKLDLSDYISDDASVGAEGTGGKSAASSGWSKEPIRLQGLDALDADVTLRASSVDLGVSQLGLTLINARLRDGLLALDLRDVRIFDGAVSGRITLRGGPSVAFETDVTARNVELEPLLSQLLDMDRLRGTGTTRLALRSQGGSVHEIMTSLSGNGSVEFGNGAIKGIDLAAMMRNLKSAFGGFQGATEFTSLDGTFSMERGVLQNVDLSLISPLFRAAGKGSVDIGGQAMNYGNRLIDTAD
ncbi:AsmA family protein [Neptunicoccus sediminis]|uniref:AsmA family protein n=1 Tax=Neptunicoccus sediminis TaxID=1892596 RepID=UPI000846065F|nr:AsmA family protein [Neptunicoccus sediminis]